jgi:hypothetical protein
MKHQGQLKRTDELREATQARTLIADLTRIVEILNEEISSQEQASGVADPSRAEYRALARTLRARRDNLLETISACSSDWFRRAWRRPPISLAFRF